MSRAAVFIFFFCLLPCAAAGDPYRLLGVLPGHSPEVTDRAFQRIKFRIHPGRHGGSQEAKERFQELEEAYDSLQDPNFRTRYDIYLKEGGQKPSKETNLYKILGVLSDSSPAELTRAYREVRGRVHPDRHGNSQLANDMLKEAKEAHETLLDPLLRARHDRILKGAGPALAHAGDRQKKETGAKSRSEKPAPAAFDEKFADPSFKPQNLEEDSDLSSWHEQVFELARELEKSGGEEDLKEAVEWYRMLAQNSHLEAMRRLPPLLEGLNMKEALYRYRIAAAEGGIGDDFRRQAAFRQAQIYHKGFSKDGREIVPKDPEKAGELYIQAFRLGVRRQDIARQYEALEDYKKAERWLTHPPSFGGQASSLRASPHKRPPDSSLLLHEGISNLATTAKQALLLPQKEEAALRITRTLLKNGEDPNAANELGETPLHLAAQNLYPKVAKALLRAGADPGIPDHKGVFPLHAAISSYTRFRSESYGWEMFFLLADKAGLQARSGPHQQTAFEMAIDLGLKPLALWIAEEAPLDYLTNEERQRISRVAIARAEEEIFQLVAANPSKYAGEAPLSQREIETMIWSGDISEQRKAVSGLQNKTAPLAPEELEALAALARETVSFSLKTAVLKILKQRPLPPGIAQEDLLELAQRRLDGGMDWEEWEIRGLLYDIISSLRRPSLGAQMRLAELAVSENPLETSLPKAALKALDRAPFFAKAAAETLFEGLAREDLSPKMRERITQSLMDFRFAEGYPKIEAEEGAPKAEQDFSNETAWRIQKPSGWETAFFLSPMAASGAGFVSMSLGFYFEPDLFYAAGAIFSFISPILTFPLSGFLFDTLSKEREKRFKSCRRAFE